MKAYFYGIYESDQLAKMLQNANCGFNIIWNSSTENWIYWVIF